MNGKELSYSGTLCNIDGAYLAFIFGYGQVILISVFNAFLYWNIYNYVRTFKTQEDSLLENNYNDIKTIQKFFFYTSMFFCI